MTTINPELKACPFCCAELTRRDGSYKHPNNECYLCAIVIFPPQYNEWNRRANATGEKTVIDDAGLAEAVKTYLNDLQAQRLGYRKYFDEPPEWMTPEISPAWEMTQEILTRCSLTPVEVDHIKSVHRFINHAVKEEKVPEVSIPDIYTNFIGGGITPPDIVIKTIASLLAYLKDHCPNGIKIIDGGA